MTVHLRLATPLVPALYVSSSGMSPNGMQIRKYLPSLAGSSLVMSSYSSVQCRSARRGTVCIRLSLFSMGGTAPFESSHELQYVLIEVSGEQTGITHFFPLLFVSLARIPAKHSHVLLRSVHSYSGSNERLATPIDGALVCSVWNRQPIRLCSLILCAKRASNMTAARTNSFLSLDRLLCIMLSRQKPTSRALRYHGYQKQTPRCCAKPAVLSYRVTSCSLPRSLMLRAREVSFCSQRSFDSTMSTWSGTPVRESRLW